MPLLPGHYKRLSIHESCHAFVAARVGFWVFGMMMDGPEANPGAVWRAHPEGKTAETARDCARWELAVFTAGYLGEREFYNGHNEPEWVAGPDGDAAMVDYFAFQQLHTEEEEKLVGEEVRKAWVPRNEWRAKFPGLRWAEYDKLKAEVEANVRKALKGNRDRVEALAKRLLADGHVRGKDVYDILGLKWHGKTRTVPWQEFP